MTKIYTAPKIKKSKKAEQSDRLYRNRRTELINEMIENKGYVYCQDCNTSNAFQFHTHHIVFRSEKPGHKNLHNKLNLINLCDVCHARYHDDKSLRNMLVEKRQLDKLFGNDVLNK